MGLGYRVYRDFFLMETDMEKRMEPETETQSMGLCRGL